MIWHISTATAEEGTLSEVISRKMNETHTMKDSIPAIQAITVTRNLGWAGPVNVVTMTINVKDRVEFDALPASLAHCEVADKAVEALRTDNFMMVQVELQSVS